MKCPACDSPEQHVLSTRSDDQKVKRLRACQACGYRWPTTELSTHNLSKLESAANAVRSLATLSKELEDASSAHG